MGAVMNGEIRTAGEIEVLSPAEQDEAFQAALVRDLADVPPGLQPLVDRVRAWVEDRIAGRGLPGAS